MIESCPTKKLKQLSSQLLVDAVSLPVLMRLRDEVDQWYANIDLLRLKHGPSKVEEHLPPGSKYLPVVSSIGLSAVMPPQQLIDGFSPDLKATLIAGLGPNPVCDVDVSWLRRQYPVCLRPPSTHPHSWHQDGAYGIDFMNLEKDDPSLLPMYTVWLPLHDCGEEAPGIEIILDSPHSFISPSKLAEKHIVQHWPERDYWQPIMKPGDALLIAGHSLHRTYCCDTMTQMRGCVDLRFLPALPLPERLASHQVISLVGC